MGYVYTDSYMQQTTTLIVINKILSDEGEEYSNNYIIMKLDVGKIGEKNFTQHCLKIVAV